MAENSKIEWCDHTFNPWEGCSKVSPGCANCYAEDRANRFGSSRWGPNGVRRITSGSYWTQPPKWNKKAQAEGVRRRVFCASLADVFEGRDTMPAEYAGDVELARGLLFRLIEDTPHLDWLLLTKRPQNVCDMYMPWLRGRNLWSREVDPTRLPRNVWIGTSVENQATADERIPRLLKVPANVRFLSMEPLLASVDLSRWLRHSDPDCPSPDSICPKCRGDVACDGASAQYRCFEHSGIHIGCGWQGDEPDDYDPGIHWLIIGGESGPRARPCDIAWIRSLVKQCKQAGVPVFVKQLGRRAVLTNQPDDAQLAPLTEQQMTSIRKIFDRMPLSLVDSKGGDMAEWPDDLRIREVPEVIHAA